MSVLSSLDGTTVNLEDLRGRFVVLSFGATWCPPCMEELPAFEGLAANFKGRPVAFFWVSIDDKDMTNDQIREDLKKNAAGFRFQVPILRDPDGNLLLHYKCEGVPTLVILGKDGAPVGGPHVGFSTPAEFQSEMTQTLGSLLK